MRLVGLLGFSWIMLDVLVNYFAKAVFDRLLPVNVVGAVLIAVVVAKWGLRPVSPPRSIASAVGIGVFGFLIGIVLLPSVELYRLVEIAGAVVVFLIGYFCLRWNNNEVKFSNWLLVIGALHVVISLLALSGVAPDLFSVQHATWSAYGLLLLRPEVMTDPNFQVFYVVPALLCFVLPFRLGRSLVTFVLYLCGLYLLIRMQTRSGLLVFLGTAFLCLLVAVKRRSLGVGKIIWVPALTVVVVAANADLSTDALGAIVTRFMDPGLSYEGAVATDIGRLVSNSYLFEHLLDPSWWIPRGYDEFVLRYGFIPHSNVTAMFLEGGLPGLYLWVAVFLAPLVVLCWRFLRGRLDTIAIMVMLGGIAFMIAQLALNVPFQKPPWLWAGAVVGVLTRLNSTQAVSHDGT